MKYNYIELQNVKSDLSIIININNIISFEPEFTEEIGGTIIQTIKGAYIVKENFNEVKSIIKRIIILNK